MRDSFYATAAAVIPVLWIALAIERGDAGFYSVIGRPEPPKASPLLPPDERAAKQQDLNDAFYIKHRKSEKRYMLYSQVLLLASVFAEMACFLHLGNGTNGSDATITFVWFTLLFLVLALAANISRRFMHSNYPELFR